jgi:predicted ATPase
MWESHPDSMKVALARHDLLMRSALEGCGGYVFKTVGDAFCAAFWTAPEALHAALEAQFALTTEPWPEPLNLSVRMAIHSGAVEHRGGDYFGQALNRVSRLMVTAHGGQVLVSDVSQDLCRESLPVGAGFRPLGEHRLKDLERPESVFQLVHVRLKADFPPLKSLNRSPNNLPVQVTSFVGRDQELQEVRVHLEQTRLLTVVGAGGSGKTRLCLQASADILSDYRDGVWFVELASLTEPDFVPRATAAIFTLREEPGRPILQTLIGYLKDKSLLLVLDNCEHLLSACAELANAILSHCSEISILASSREAMGLAGEQTYHLPTLSLPERGSKDILGAVADCEAGRLFVARAHLHKPEFRLTNENAAAVAEICRSLDGIPLALELAAARLRAMSVEEVHRRLGQRFRLLAGGNRTALPRHQTLRSLFDWSYELLDDHEQALLCRLSVFSGGWSVELAEGICTDSLVEDQEVLDLLSSLVEKSLVLTEECDGVTRYGLLESVRQYARDRLFESGDEEVWRARHFAYILKLSEEAEPELSGPNQGQWFELLENEHDNLRAALDWSIGVPNGGENAARLCGNIWPFWDVKGHFSEGRERILRALGGPGSVTDSTRASALIGAGVLADAQGDLMEAERLLEEARGVFKKLGDTSGIGSATKHLGYAAYHRGEYALARERFEEALAISRQEGDQIGEATNLNNLGFLHYDLGDSKSAYLVLEESLSIRRKVGDPRGMAFALLDLADVALDQNEIDAAGAVTGEAKALFQELGDPWGIALCSLTLGQIACKAGTLRDARKHLMESLAIFRDIGDRITVAPTFDTIAGLLLSSGFPKDAAVLLSAAARLRREIGSLISPVNKSRIEQLLVTARAASGDEASFEAAWAKGSEMATDLAINFALSELVKLSDLDPELS